MKCNNLFATFALVLSLIAGSAFAQSASVDINTADTTTLATLSGVGQSKAQAIVDYRNTHGPFTSTEDLANVKGIGRRTVDKNADRLTVQGADTATAP